MASEEVIEVATLGRPFRLGMLYDCRRDKVIPGLTLWDSEELEKYKRETPQRNSEFEIVASESIEDKSSALGVEASLKASFLCGLVTVEGSAKYLNDQMSSKNQARVTLKYKVTTKFQELTMNHLGRGNMKHPYVFENKIATHVVTGILYGAQAFFVFDQEKSETESHQDIQGNLKVSIEKIPLLSVEGKGSVHLEDKDKERIQKFSCKFHGDFLLEKTPTTFQDAVAIYQSLPKLLGASGENAVPIKVWMLPLTNLDSSAAKLVREISVRLVQEVQSVLEELSDVEIRCNDAMKNTTTLQFPQINKKLKRFKSMCFEFRLGFQRTLAKKLPSIRGGGEEESELADVLKKIHSSPFNSKNLNDWIDCKEREIHALKSYTRMMKNKKIIPSQNILDEELLTTEHAVCFVFSSLERDEPYLSALSNYLKGKTKSDDSHSYDVEKEQWYLSTNLKNEMRRKVKLFRDFSEANIETKSTTFLAVGLTDEKHEGSTIYLYEDGFLINENFEPPSIPETVTAADITHSSVTLKVSPPRFGAESITSYSVEFCVRGQDEWTQQIEPKSGEITVTQLQPNTEYMFRCRAVTSAGVGPANVTNDPIKTLPCSPPGEPQGEPNSFDASVTWKKPAELGPNVQISCYILEYAETGEASLVQWNQLKTKTLKETIVDLQSDTQYAIRVQCDCAQSGRSRESQIVFFRTSQPYELQLQEILQDLPDLEARWEKALQSITAQQFQEIQDKLTTFKDLILHFKDKTLVRLKQSSPSVLRKQKNQQIIENEATFRLSTPFNKTNLMRWMICKENEINVLQSLTKMMPKTEIISQNGFNEIINTMGQVICFVFTSLGTDDPLLSALSAHLRGTRPDNLHDAEKEPWFVSKKFLEEIRLKTKLFCDFAEANTETKSSTFLAVGLTDEKHEGSTIYLYKDGFLLNENFEPPSKPETVTAADITHSSVTLNVSPPRFGAESITSYSVEFCVRGQDEWRQQIEPKSGEITVTQLQPNTEYMFRCRAVTSAGVGPANVTNDPIKTLPCSPPGEPQGEPNSSDISVSWEKPAELGPDVQILSYIVEYAKAEDLIWNQTRSTGEKFIISGLQSETQYALRITCDCGEAGRSKESKIVQVNTTKPNMLPDAVKAESTKLKPQIGPLPVYKVPLKKENIRINGCRFYRFGEPAAKQSRTIMVLGATGAGKSTLINGMINYILGVKWSDSYRLVLVDDGPTKSQAHSQTSEVTVYKLNHRDGFEVPFSLTIIDTPGFGDTRGIDRDREITEQIHNLFTSDDGVSDIDAVCFVAQAALARLTPTQKYVFDSILSIFGKDIAENIRILVTFADGQKPPVLEAIKASGVPSPKGKDGLPVHFKFNNSALFADNKSSAADALSDDDDGIFDQMFWNMGTNSMKMFFAALNQIETKSLTLTKEVLRERKQLEVSVENLQLQVKFGLAKMEEIRETREKIKEHEAEISRNEDFEFYVTVKKKVQVDISGTGNFITNCQQCQVTCHFPCPIPNDADKRKCVAMDRNTGYCCECPGKCYWNVHVNQKYRWEYRDVTEKRTIKDLKENYEKATGEKMTVEGLMRKLEAEYGIMQDEVNKLIDKSAKCLNRLKEIALKPNPLTTPEFIDLLIEEEKQEGKLGWKQRVESLMKMKQKAEIMAQVEKGEKPHW